MSEVSFTRPTFSKLPPQALTEFRELYKRKYGIRLSREIAAQKAILVINIFEVFSKFKRDKGGEQP